jgi:hypothetical protein
MKLMSIGGSALAVSPVALFSGGAPQMALAQSITCTEGTASAPVDIREPQPTGDW